MLKIQPSEFVDNIRDGHKMTKLPYPFFVEENGLIDQQSLWRGDPYRVAGFQADLANQKIDVTWEEALRDPQSIVGMYLVTANTRDEYSTHSSAIKSVEPTAAPVSPW